MVDRGLSTVSSVPSKDEEPVVERVDQLQTALRGVTRPSSVAGRFGLDAAIKLSVSVGRPFVIALELLTLQSALLRLNTNEGVDTG